MLESFFSSLKETNLGVTILLIVSLCQYIIRLCQYITGIESIYYKM